MLFKFGKRQTLCKPRVRPVLSSESLELCVLLFSFSKGGNRASEAVRGAARVTPTRGHRCGDAQGAHPPENQPRRGGRAGDTDAETPMRGHDAGTPWALTLR